MLSTEGEGVRIYYTLASHAKTDSSYVNFQGMNYPYGEHIIFCDAQPLVTNTYRFITKVFPKTIDYAVGIQNLISLYGLILGALLFYFFFLIWKISPWYSALLAFSLMMISPQVLRMPWQPSLSYFFSIPLILLLFQQYVKNQNLKWTIIISLVTLSVYFINPYIGVISTLFFGLIMLALLYLNGSKTIKLYVFGVTQTLLPSLLYYLYVKLTDVRTDRVDIPFGLHEFTANFTSFFTSPYTPLKSFYESLGTDMANLQMHFEGMAYVGASCSFGMIFLTVLFFYTKMKGRSLLIYINIEQRILLFVAGFFFMLALGFPFVFHPLFEKLLDLFKPLRQLKALGRMSWMFTFCINIVVFSSIYFIIKEKVKTNWLKKTAFTIVALLLLFTSYEGSFLHREVYSHQAKGNTFLKSSLKTVSKIEYIDEALNQIDASKYSAIVPIPYFHFGSELFVTKSHTSYVAMLEAISFAYHADLPLTACYLSRISIAESKKSLQFFAHSMIEKEIKSDVHTNKPFLFFHSKTAPIPSDEEQRLLKLGKIVYETDLISLVEVYPEDIWKTNEKEVFSWLVNYKDQYIKKENLYYFKDKGEPVYLSYNNLKNDLGFNSGGFEYAANEKSYFFDQQKDAPYLKSGKYDLSFWFETSSNRMQATLVQEKLDDNNIISTTELHDAKRSFTIKDNWIRWGQSIDIIDGYSVRFYFKQPSNQSGLIVDELLLSPEKSSVFVQYNEKNWMWNNYPFRVN